MTEHELSVQSRDSRHLASEALPVSTLRLQPRLEHQDVPQVVVPVAGTFLMLPPFGGNGLGPEEPLSP